MSRQPEGNEPSRSTNVVGAYQARNALGQLLDRVEQGETIVITRHGRPVARLLPYLEPDHVARVERALAVFERIAKGKQATTEEILAWIRAGRR
jgi:prevent-host-death family protein